MSEAERRPLFERAVADGRRAAERLARDRNVLAVWLSGPFTAQRLDPESDLHMAVLTGSEGDRADRQGLSGGDRGGRSDRRGLSDGDRSGRADRHRLPARTGGGSVYVHQLPRFSEVGRRLEIAYLPLRRLEGTIARGLSRWGDVFDCHKLSDVVILFERDGIVGALRERLRKLRPTHMFVGAAIGVLRSELELAARQLEAGRSGESIVHARKLASAALMLFALAARGLLFSKSSQLRGMLAGHAPRSRLDDYDRLQGIGAIGAGEAERIVRRCSDIVGSLYRRKGVCAADSG